MAFTPGLTSPLNGGDPFLNLCSTKSCRYGEGNDRSIGYNYSG